MGFLSRFVESGFWNFDALYVPQQHPARDLQDTVCDLLLFHRHILEDIYDILWTFSLYQ